MRYRDVDVMILGGGVIGSSIAWALAERGREVSVVDLDLAGIYASSELNAGGARATWWQRVNVETCAETLGFFRDHREEFGFRERGYLWLYENERRFAVAREKAKLQNAYGLDVEILDVATLKRRFPFIDRNVASLVGATFSPRDGLVNPNAVRAFYRKRAEDAGARFESRHYVSGVSTEREDRARRVSWLDVLELAVDDPLDEAGGLREILTTHRVPSELVVEQKRWRPRLVINCLGAWSPVFSAKVGITDVTQPTRRQISLLRAQPDDPALGEALYGMGMIVDTSDVYLHPEGADILAGYSTPEEVPGYDFDYDGARFFEEQIWPRLAARSSVFERCRHVRGWAGLYATTPDCSGIAGPVRGFSNLWEAHSFTGRGVMQSFGIGRAIAELVIDGKSRVDISPLERERFEDRSRWQVEDLHI